MQSRIEVQPKWLRMNFCRDLRRSILQPVKSQGHGFCPGHDDHASLSCCAGASHRQAEWIAAESLWAERAQLCRNFQARMEEAAPDDRANEVSAALRCLIPAVHTCSRTAVVNLHGLNGANRAEACGRSIRLLMGRGFCAGARLQMIS